MDSIPQQPESVPPETRWADKVKQPEPGGDRQNAPDERDSWPDEATFSHSDIFANVAQPAEEWESLARQLLEQKLVAEAICAQARASASNRRIAGLIDILKEAVTPQNPEAAQSSADSLAQQSPGELRALALGLEKGADAATVLCAMATILDHRRCSRAALDYINAAILLAPDQRKFLFTRAMALINLGLDQHAELDARALATVEPEKASFLLDYTRVVFPVFDFWPAKEVPQTYYEGLPSQPAHSLEAIREVIQKYATRLATIRAAMLDLVKPQRLWMLPDLSALLPHGPVELGVFSLQVAHEGEEPQTVEVNEALNIDGWDLPQLLCQTRADWSALAWLCWSVGMDKVALPTKVCAPAEYGQAAGMSAQRLWRCHDQVESQGANAKAGQVPPFDWEGLNIDDLPVSLAKVAQSQYAEMQAMFKWLSFAENQSPWQDNLRSI